MSDSSWQQAVLREIGVSRRGLQVLDATPSAPAQGTWGADAPPRPAEERAPAASVPAQVTQAARPEPQPAPVQAAQPVQAAPEAPPPVPEAPPFPQVADASQGAQDEPAPLLPEPPAPEPVAPEPVVPEPVPSPQIQQQAAAQQPVQQPAFQEQAFQEQAFQEQAAQQAAAQQQAVTRQQAAPHQPMQPAEQQQPPQQAEQQQPPQQTMQQAVDVPAETQQQIDPLVHSDFDWEAAVNPVLGAVQPAADQAAHQGQRAGQQGAWPDPAAAAQQHAQPAAPVQPVMPGQPAGPGQVPGQEIPPADLVRRNQHGDALARRVGRGVLKAVGGGAREARLLAAFGELMQRSVPSSRQIAVASVRGGAGKTTMAALVATELARHRADRVLAADADAELGSLPLRLGVRSQLSLFELAAQNPQSFEEAARFLTRTPDGLWVLSSTRGGRIAGEFTLETFETALSAVSRYVAATVVDCGAGILTEVNRGVIAGSHGLVLVTPGTVDGALSARGALEWFVSNDQQDVLRRTVIAMVSHAPQVGADLQRAHQMLAAWGLPVVAVPYDRHLATGSSLELGRVSAAARMAGIQVVHEVFARSLGAGVAR
ncbi:CpaE family protein [Actinomadura nitritigenes]|uniref:AAA family ATPase n=1 Tax=Actinomadura nitritigenes TaxID=134602 RepID=UPI00369807DE